MCNVGQFYLQGNMHAAPPHHTHTITIIIIIIHAMLVLDLNPAHNFEAECVNMKLTCRNMI